MPYDLHMHSTASDGELAPSGVVALAKAAGMDFIALTDHDTLDGLSEAFAAGMREDVAVISGVEMEAESPFELHILGLGVDIQNPPFFAAIEKQKAERSIRNEAILKKLREAGIELLPYYRQGTSADTRVHIAQAMVRGGYVRDIKEAFSAYLEKGGIAFIPLPRRGPEEIIALIRQAGGMAVLAHPCQIQGYLHELLPRLSAYGLEGIEAYYPTSTPGQQALCLSLARQYGLLVTAGSDFHGSYRMENLIGGAYRDTPPLRETERTIRERFIMSP